MSLHLLDVGLISAHILAQKNSFHFGLAAMIMDTKLVHEFINAILRTFPQDIVKIK